MLGTVFGSWVKHFLNLIYPLSCLTCKVRLTPLSDRPLCEICWNKIELILPPFCRVCGKHLPAPLETDEVARPAKSQNRALICKDCQRSSYFFRAARSVCIYDGVIKKCIHLFKYQSKLSLLKPLSRLMIGFAGNFLNMKNIDLIIPVPLHSSKLRLRQFNQAQILAKSINQAFSKELQDRLLVKIRPGPAQVNLSQAERLKNVRGTFKVKNVEPLKDKTILLIDDVLTTGATAGECARMLLEAGAGRVDVFALARSR